MNQSSVSTQRPSHGCLSAVTFTYLEQEDCTSSLSLSLSLGESQIGCWASPPNHHVGTIPIIQFGDSPACTSPTWPSTNLSERFMSL